MTGPVPSERRGAGSFDGLVAIVDDDLSVRRALARLLTSVGVRNEVHGSGLEFLDSPALHDADCLLLDLHLAGMSGAEVLEGVRVTASKLPVILMTGRYGVDFAEKALGAGVSALLRKPFSEEELFDALAEATGKSVHERHP